MRTLLGVAILSMLSLSAHATLNRDSVTGELIKPYPAGADRPDEICVLPQHFADGDYSEKDLKDEKELCDMDKNSTAAVCGKLESSNPGLNFYKVKDGQTAEGVARNNCADAKKL